jgi:hypothetical protein
MKINSCYIKEFFFSLFVHKPNNNNFRLQGCCGFKDVILITGTETDKIAKFTVESAPARHSVTANTTCKVAEDIVVISSLIANMYSVYAKEKKVHTICPSGKLRTVSESSIIKAGTKFLNL